MSGPITITSPQQLSTLLSSSRIVVVKFYNEWNAMSETISAVYDSLADQISRPGAVTFAKVNAEQQPQIAQSYQVASLPAFIIFKTGSVLQKINGANTRQLHEAIKRLAAEANSDEASDDFGGAGSSSGSGGAWLGASLPRGYTDVTDQVDVRGLDLLNADSEFGTVRTLFETSAPKSLGKGKGKGASTGGEAKPDWVESDVDEQLMLYIPFTSTLKVHTIQITSLPPTSNDDDDDDDDDDDEAPVRPKTVHIYTNKQHNLGFEEAEDITATQTIELKPSDWDAKTGTAKLELRFVKFQSVSSLVLFVADGEGESEKTRIDRIHIIGESGEKRDMGKLEKVGHDD
ncbi:DUF1000-domain-containing protein [Aaosphaeria arxii CBS 175.79]|uniref:DUF1000-domain-containing protein n=1 Tax=Aaosphaeria arxii CBS 175.79 TaxID=1450172 RepID=A0A6A5XSL0_9PLEO|nr:DUF1000-domain-containing protein [Aaosphaeria arxii CBS 175.79]KAF2015896.1 DUF1000-domain-containing protein [Aaosphaeria arxii CBS 175.79]